MQDVFEKTSQPTLVLNADLKIIHANAAFVRMSGIGGDALFMRKYQDLPLESRNGDDPATALAQKRCGFSTISFRFRTGPCILEEQTMPVPDGAGLPGNLVVLFRNLTSDIRSAEATKAAHAKLQHDYGERVKEQTLFYATAKLIQDDTQPPASILRQIVCLVPPGWQYPEICEARITFANIDVKTPGYREVRWKQQAEIITKDGSRGTIEVVYLDEKPHESEGPFLLEERNLINSLTEMLKTYLDRKTGEVILEKKYQEQAKLLHDYGERVKEQTLFYATAKLIQDDSLKWEQILGKIVRLIPPGWQYPDVCAARIQYEEVIVTTPNYRDTRWKQSAEFSVKGKTGLLEIVYLVEKPQEAEGPFLLEERNLINSLAEMLKTYLDRKKSEQDLDNKLHEQAKLLHDYGERVKEQTLFYATAKLIQDDTWKWEQILEKIVRLIPPGWQYPDVCAARIRFEDVIVTTPNYRDTCWKQSAEFSVKGKTGILEIVYLEEKPQEAEGPFLLEERNLINSLAEMLKTYLDRKKSEQDLDSKFHEIAAIQRYMEQEVAGLSAVYAKMGKGDLTLRYDISGPDERTKATHDQLQKMQDAVQGIIGSLQKNISTVNREMESLIISAGNAVRYIQDASGEIGDISRNSGLVSTNAAEVSGGIDQILHAAGDLSASVEEITSSMSEVRAISGQANARSHEGSVLAARAEKNMGEIAGSTENVSGMVAKIGQQMADISKIVSLIRDIANQTNLLALNAAIEAARAGDAGRGFAVVAAEVKSLAQESKRSAEQIEEMINNLKEEAKKAASAMEETRSVVSKGTSVVTETLGAFTRIASDIEKVAASASDVATATGEQAATTEKITGRIHEIAGRIRATAEEAGESAASTRELSAGICEISRMVEQVNTIALSALGANRKFRVGDMIEEKQFSLSGGSDKS
ncbi:methyl-accepting chemotaxis protein [Methanoregula sp.]|uniref:methyl-accepting chemotaxis protein n=1 Tax=Methanoregula sp. TaxID=2052170 RepID=UPI00356A1E97